MRIGPWAGIERVFNFEWTRGSRVVALVSVFAVAAAMRLPALDASGFAEDEIDKLRAASAYGAGDFTADPEHPMLMKLAVAGSLRAGAIWNRTVGESGRPRLSEEALLRAPNAVAGALTAPALFLLAGQLFTPATGAIAALLWAVDPNAIAVNRIGKEDSFLVLFLFAAAWLYERGKSVGRTDPVAAQRWFGLAGAAFGLMMASKYMPYYVALHILYFRAAEAHPGRNRPDKPRYFGAMAAAFLVANVAILLPANWAAIAAYLGENPSSHLGYAVAGEVYVNRVGATPWGVPVWAYGAFLMTKVPLLTLMAATVGLVHLLRQRTGRGAVFGRVFLLFTLIPYSLVASKFMRYLLPVFAVIDIIAAAGLVAILAVATRRLSQARRAPATVAATAAMLATVAGSSIAAAPFFGLHQNVIGERVSQQRLLFPHDELYDAGLREAVAYVAATAGQGDVIFSDAPAAARTYLDLGGRPDIGTHGLSNGTIGPGQRAWILVQDGRLYFENRQVIEDLRRRKKPAHQIWVRNHLAVEVFAGW